MLDLARVRADLSNYHDSMSIQGAAAVAAHVPELLAELDRLTAPLTVAGCTCPCCREMPHGH